LYLSLVKSGPLGWTVAASRKEKNRAVAVEAERRRTQTVTTHFGLI